MHETPRGVAGAMVLAVAAGVGYALALPPFDVWPLGWVCVAPLMLAVRGRPWWQAGLLGWLAGWVYAVLVGWWVWVGAHYYFGASRLVSTSFIALVVGPACGIGVAVAAAVAEWAARGPRPLPRLVAGPLAWMLGEVLRVAGPFAMPWCLLAATQVSAPVFLQPLELGGPLLLGGLLALVNACIAEAIARPAVRTRCAAAAAVVFATLALGGAARMASVDVAGGGAPVAVGLVQGNIPQQERWLREHWGDHERIHAHLSYRARNAGAEAIVWPETSAGQRGLDASYLGADLARIAGPGRTLIAGCVGTAGDARYNVVLSAAHDETPEVYRKRELVPFGEAVPANLAALDFLGMRKAFPHPFSAGPEPPALLEHAEAPVGAMICYEYLFPETLASTVRAGARWLVVVSNDAWYDTTPAPVQHHAQVALAAVATRRYVARATNTGISGAFDPRGRALAFEAGELAAATRGRGGAFEYHQLDAGTERLPLRRAGWGLVHVRPREGETLFVRLGNWPMWVAIVWWGGYAVGKRINRRDAKGEEGTTTDEPDAPSPQRRRGTQKEPEDFPLRTRRGTKGDGCGKIKMNRQDVTRTAETQRAR